MNIDNLARTSNFFVDIDPPIMVAIAYEASPAVMVTFEKFWEDGEMVLVQYSTTLDEGDAPTGAMERKVLLSGAKDDVEKEFDRIEKLLRQSYRYPAVYKKQEKVLEKLTHYRDSKIRGV